MLNLVKFLELQRDVITVKNTNMSMCELGYTNLMKLVKLFDIVYQTSFNLHPYVSQLNSSVVLECFFLINSLLIIYSICYCAALKLNGQVRDYFPFVLSATEHM